MIFSMPVFALQLSAAEASTEGGGKSNFYHYDVVDGHRVALEQAGSAVGAGYYERGSNSGKFAQLLEIR